MMGLLDGAKRCMGLSPRPPPIQGKLNLTLLLRLRVRARRSQAPHANEKAPLSRGLSCMGPCGRRSIHVPEQAHGGASRIWCRPPRPDELQGAADAELVGHAHLGTTAEGVGRARIGA